MFEDRLLVDNAQPCCVTWRDTLRSQGVAAYRVVRTHKESQREKIPHTGSNFTLYNPGYEIAVNAAVPDGNYPGVAKDIASTFFRDSRLSTEGLHSLRLHTSNGTGVMLSPYRFSGNVQANAAYEFSIDLRGAKGGEKMGFQFSSSLFTVEGSSSGIHVAVATRNWTRVSINLKGASTGGASTGWLSYGMQTPGDVWLDNMQLVEMTKAIIV